jgi:HD-GYP domain-containing protein (c-di-GMP phosphodiesterase class II)
LTCPLVVTPITGEKPWTVVATVFARSAWIEAAQYLIGLLGALAAVADIWAVSLLALPTALVYIAGRRSMEIEESTQQVLASMADAVDLRDPLTGGHSRRVTKLVRDVLQEMAIHGSEAEMIVAAARVHDIGKIAIPDHILLKDGPLTEDEWEVVKSHSERGADLLQRYPDFASGVAIIRHHHESWDGTGYPHRLAGEQIPFGARVIAVVDSFDAMTTDRPYRRGMSVEQAVTVLRKNRGVQWDPRVVDAFLRTMSRQYPEDVPALRIVPFAGQGPAATA